MSELPTSMLMTGEEFIDCMQSGAISSWPFYQNNTNLKEDELFWRIKSWPRSGKEKLEAIMRHGGPERDTLILMIFPSMYWAEIMRRDVGR